MKQISFFSIKSFLFLFLSFLINFPLLAIELSDSFSSVDKNAIQTLFDNLKRIQGQSSSPLFNEIFNSNSIFEGRLDGNLVMKFVELRVKKLEAMPEEAADKIIESESGEPFFNPAYLQPRIIGGVEGPKEMVRDTIYFNKKTLNEDIGFQLIVLSTIIHESFHADSEDGHAHLDCPSAMLRLVQFPEDPSGVKGACDQDEDGAYGIEAIFLGNVYRFANGLTQKSRIFVRNFLASRLAHIIDVEAQRRILDDLELDETLTRNDEVTEERHAEIVEARKSRSVTNKVVFQKRQSEQREFFKKEWDKEQAKKRQEEIKKFDEEKKKIVEEQKRKDAIQKAFSGVSIRNQSSKLVVFYYKWGNGEWVEKLLPVGEIFLLNTRGIVTSLGLRYPSFQHDIKLSKKKDERSYSLSPQSYPSEGNFELPFYEFQDTDLGRDPEGYARTVLQLLSNKKIVYKR